MRNEYHNFFSQVSHTMQVVGNDGTEQEFEMADPSRLIQLTLDRSEQLQEMWETVLDKHEQPWRVVVGYDEFSPGFPRRSNAAVVRDFSTENEPADVHQAAGSVLHICLATKCVTSP